MLFRKYFCRNMVCEFANKYHDLEAIMVDDIRSPDKSVDKYIVEYENGMPRILGFDEATSIGSIFFVSAKLRQVSLDKIKDAPENALSRSVCVYRASEEGWQFINKKLSLSFALFGAARRGLDGKPNLASFFVSPNLGSTIELQETMAKITNWRTLNNAEKIFRSKMERQFVSTQYFQSVDELNVYLEISSTYPSIKDLFYAQEYLYGFWKMMYKLSLEWPRSPAIQVYHPNLAALISNNRLRRLFSQT